MFFKKNYTLCPNKEMYIPMLKANGIDVASGKLLREALAQLLGFDYTLEISDSKRRIKVSDTRYEIVDAMTEAVLYSGFETDCYDEFELLHAMAKVDGIDIKYYDDSEDFDTMYYPYKLVMKETVREFSYDDGLLVIENLNSQQYVISGNATISVIVYPVIGYDTDNVNAKTESVETGYLSITLDNVFKSMLTNQSFLEIVDKHKVLKKRLK